MKLSQEHYDQPVHSNPELCAPLSDPKCESSIESDRPKGDRTVGRAALVSQDAADQAELEDCGSHVENDRREDEADASAAPVYCL